MYWSIIYKFKNIVGELFEKGVNHRAKGEILHLHVCTDCGKTIMIYVLNNGLCKIISLTLIQF